MPCDELPDHLRAFWEEVGMNHPVLSLDQVREEANRLHARRRRGQIVLIACMPLFAASYGLSFFLFPNLLARVGGALTAMVCTYWLVHALKERARAGPDQGETDGLSFYRGELEHTRDVHRWLSWRWLLLLGPFILFDVGVAQVYAKVWPLIVLFACFDCALLLAVFAIWLPRKNFRLARKYQETIDALDAASGRGQPHRGH